MYTQYEDSEEPVMLLDTHIGNDPDEGPGIDAALFVEELLRLDAMNKKRIQIWINSPGGIVTDGMAIYSAMLKTKTKVDTYVTALAASIAAVIFQAGRTRTMADYAILMYHNAFGGDGGTLELINECLTTMIERSGMDRKEIVSMMNDETFLSASEAKLMGLCDQIEYSTDFNKKRATGSTMNMATQLRTILNKSKSLINSKPLVVWNCAVQMNIIASNNQQYEKPAHKTTPTTEEGRSFEGMMQMIARNHNQI